MTELNKNLLKELKARLQKRAFTPPPPGIGNGPIDEASIPPMGMGAGGMGMPMDPSMMGGGMDPSMMGGMDPSMMEGAPPEGGEEPKKSKEKPSKYNDNVIGDLFNKWDEMSQRLDALEEKLGGAEKASSFNELSELRDRVDGLTSFVTAVFQQGSKLSKTAEENTELIEDVLSLLGSK